MDQPKFDLHSALSAMADYPAMLRRLGVVRVVEVDLAGTGINPAADVTISVKPSWTAQLPPNAGEEPGKNVNVVPVAVPVHLSASRFSLLQNGFVESDTLGVAEIDVDHAASRLLGLARRLVDAVVPGTQALDAPGAPLPQRLSLPSLKGAGLSLTQTGRAQKTRERLQVAAKLFSATEETPLSDPEHAVKGFVVDVWDDRTKRWHTLCARRGTYKLPGGRSFTADDEGSVSSAATAKLDAEAGTMMYLHESMVRWHGWSLVAPPVGTPVVTESKDRVLTSPSAPALPGFEVSFTPQPGTLPVLRFGRGYRFRLRAMDIVGQADPLDPASTDFTHAFPADAPAKHLRFDPVLAPVVVAGAPMTEGESVETLVVRPDPGLAGVVSKLLGPLLATQPIRHLAPPKVSVGLVEEHGMVDTAAGRPDPSKYKMLADRDRADLSTVGTPDPRQPLQRYVSGSLSVSWLPDPICRGAVITGLPGGPAKVRFDPPLLGAWPNVQAARIQLADGNAGWSWNPLLRVLTLYVPRGETRTVQLSSFVDSGDVPLLGHVSWLTEAGAAPDVVAAASADVQAGQAWQMTPPRTLTLVNAVRTPTVAPSLVTIGNDSSHKREPGSTSHSLVGNAQVNRPSTGLMALVATRTEVVDDLSAPGPATVTTITRPPLRENTTTVTEQAPAIPVAYDPDPVTGSQISFAATHVLGDTRRHQVSYAVEATTRYLEHFVQRGRVTFSGTTALQLSTIGMVPGTAAVRSTDGKVAYRPGEEADFVVDTQAGTIARTATSTIPDGTPVDVALVAPPATKTGNALTLDLPSTARPAAPKVAWVVPTFGWTDQTSNLGLKRVRTRTGGGLRVFLDRPWYSSGTGEQLAVVLATGPVDASDHQLRELVTQLGVDPVVKTEAPTAGFPAIGQFPLAKDNKPALSVPELADRGAAGVVAVAVHDVEWDADRQRWACDIVLPPGRVYGPFVHLALARYQPNSLPGLELSAISPLEWAQLAPDRAATVLLDALDLTKVTLTVTGWSPAGTDTARNKPNAVSAILQTTSALNPGDLDWTTVGAVDGQALTATSQPDGTTSWNGVIRLPKNRLLTAYRLVITEQEQYGGGGRLVYSDAIRI